MNQPHDAIQPRRRLRSATTSPTAARAERSTRVLIRVPAVSVGLTSAAAGIVAGQQSSVVERGETNRGRTEANPGSVGLRTLLNETTAKKHSGSPRSSVPEQAESPPEPAEVRSGSASVGQKAAVPLKMGPASPTAQPHFRIDEAHADSTGPHLAAEAWLDRPASWLTDLLGRRSLLAVVLIIAGVIGLAIVLHNRAQHHALRPETDPATNASRSNLKGDVRFPEAAAGAPSGQNNQNVVGTGFSNGGNSDGMFGSVLAAQQTTAESAGPPPAGTTSVYRAEGSQSDYFGAGQGQWNEPAGANTPASIQPTDPRQAPGAAANTPAMGQPTIYSAQRWNVPPGGSANGAFSGVTPGAAAFDGSIKNPSMQFSR